MAHDEITPWLSGIAKGDERAAQQIWERYYEQLVRLADRKLGSGARRVSDEEDVALSAMHSFFRGATAGRFPQLDDRHDLWKLLVTITARKAIAHQRRRCRQKRGGGTVRGESVFRRADDSDAPGINDVLGQSPTPQFAAQINEECARLLECLDDESLRDIALRKLEGYSNGEIAEQMNCATRTIERKLARIRNKWSSETES